MTKLTFSPTTFTSLVLSWRGKRIFGCSAGQRRNSFLICSPDIRLERDVCVLTHDLSDGDGLRERGGGAAAGDVDGHHPEQHLLPHWQIFHLVLVLLHWLLVGLDPLVS